MTASREGQDFPRRVQCVEGRFRGCFGPFRAEHRHAEAVSPPGETERRALGAALATDAAVVGGRPGGGRQPARCGAQQQHGERREAQQKDHVRPSCAEDCSTAPRHGLVPNARAMARGAKGALVEDVANSLGPSEKEAARGGRERLVMPVASAATKHVRCSMGAIARRRQRGPYSTLYMPPPPCTSRGAPPLPSAIVLGIASS